MTKSEHIQYDQLLCWALQMIIGAPPYSMQIPRIVANPLHTRDTVDWVPFLYWSNTIFNKVDSERRGRYADPY